MLSSVYLAPSLCLLLSLIARTTGLAMPNPAAPPPPPTIIVPPQPPSGPVSNGGGNTVTYTSAPSATTCPAGNGALPARGAYEGLQIWASYDTWGASKTLVVKTCHYGQTCTLSTTATACLRDSNLKAVCTDGSMSVSVSFDATVTPPRLNIYATDTCDAHYFNQHGCTSESVAWLPPNNAPSAGTCPDSQGYYYWDYTPAGQNCCTLH